MCQTCGDIQHISRDIKEIFLGRLTNWPVILFDEIREIDSLVEVLSGDLICNNEKGLEPNHIIIQASGPFYNMV